MREKVIALVAFCLFAVLGSDAFAQYCPNCGCVHASQGTVYEGGIVVEQAVPQSPAVQVARATPVRNAVGAVAHAAVNMVRGAANDALAEVNAARARRGLRPFLPDPLLTQGAMACARVRADSRIQGHLSNDFSYLPQGARARGAGCAAWEPSLGWGACCTFDDYTYAGAAWAIGIDGKRYMHLFVR